MKNKQRSLRRLAATALVLVVALMVMAAGVMITPAVADAQSCDARVASSAELQASLSNPACEGQVIRIAAGTYTPEHERDPGDPRSRAFTVTVNDLTLRGNGLGKTRLSGDLGIPADATDNAYHVITVDASGVTSIRFEHLAIMHGNADIDDFDPNLDPPPCRENRGMGGGLLFCDPQEGATVALNHVAVTDNYALFAGAGVRIGPSFAEGLAVMSVPPRLEITRSRFEGNLAGVEPVEGQPGGRGQGGGVFASYVNVDVERTNFVNNRSGSVGGAIEVIEGAASVRRSNFVGNTSVAAGGAIRVLVWDPEVQQASEISNSTFENNGLSGVDERGSVFQRGGAVMVEGYANPDVGFTIRRNTFSGNRSVGIAGAVEVVNANAEVTRNRFVDNESLAGSGGALQITTLPLEFRGGVAGPRVVVTRNQFDRNSSSTVGGALSINELYVPPQPFEAVFEVSDNGFRQNAAFEGGGALSVDARLVTTSRNVFLENRASGFSSITGEPVGNGGAVLATSNARHAGALQFLAPVLGQDDLTELITTLVVDESRFVGNHALRHGGAISDDQPVTASIFLPGLIEPSATFTPTGPGLARIRITNSRFTNNVADEGFGGAVAITGAGQSESYILTPFTPGTSPWVADPNSLIVPSTLDLSGNRITRNAAGSGGGGVYITEAAELHTVSNNAVRSNAPDDCAGCS